MIQAQQICFHYKNRPNLLQNVSFDLEQGSLLAILGNNGAGKSTLLKCIHHILRPDSGRFLLEGEDLLSMPVSQVARRAAFVSQTVADIDMTVKDMVMLGRRPYMRWSFSKEDYHIVYQAMERLKLLDMGDHLLRRLSGGERQKVMLARALAQRPRLLLLDEPTSSLDLQNQYQVMRIIQELCHRDGLTGIMVIHDLSLALRFCDRFLLMHKGKVCRYGTQDVLDSGALKEVYGVEAEIAEIGGKHIILVKE